MTYYPNVQLELEPSPSHFGNGFWEIYRLGFVAPLLSVASSIAGDVCAGKKLVSNQFLKQELPSSIPVPETGIQSEE